MKLKNIIVVLFTIFTYSLSAATDINDIDKQWSSANESYVSGNFADAITKYKDIAKHNLESERLYYNIGNSYYKMDSLGKAILYYKKALNISPNDEDVRHNLNIANAHTVNRITEIPEFFLVGWFRNMVNMFSSNTWAVVGVVLFGVSLVMSIIYLLSSSVAMRKVSFFAGVILLVFALWSSVNSLMMKNNKINSKEAVVMSSAAPVKSSPDSSGNDVFVLNEGAVLDVLSTVGNWSEIVIANGNKGWVMTKYIEMVEGDI